MGLLSPEEKIYIVHGADQNLRSDGRGRCEFRPIELETDVMPSAMGSSRVKIGSTDVVACVKANTFTPPPNKPNEGKLEILVHFSGVCDPEYEGRNSEQLRDRYTHILNKLYSSVRLNDWCIVEKVKCWRFNVDVCVSSLNGNLYDAIGLAVKSALASSVVPVVKVNKQDKGEYEFSIDDDPNGLWTPKVSGLPIFLTGSKLGEAMVLDCTAQEEQCCSSSVVMACTQQGKILYSMKTGSGSLHPTTLSSMVHNITNIAVDLNKEIEKLIVKLKSNISEETFGYL